MLFRSDRVELQYQQSHGVAQIELRDNGCGFATKTVTSGQFGLMGMRERADAIGARLDIVSHPDRGTSVRVWVEVPA